MDDRDLQFFDTMLADLKKENKVDEKQIYSTGPFQRRRVHLLTVGRTRRPLRGRRADRRRFSPEIGAKLKRSRCCIWRAENDRLVKYEWQQAAIEHLKSSTSCGDGKPWEEGCVIYDSKLGTPVVAYIPSPAPTASRQARSGRL